MDNVKLDIGVIRWSGVEFIDLTDDRGCGPVDGSCECHNKPSDSIK